VSGDLASELRRALESKEMVPYFQPLVDLRTERILGFEVLARWHHPIRQLVLPGEFIPAAENCGLIGALTESLLHQSCLAATAWPSDILISVNLSPSQLRDRALPGRIHRCAERSGFPPNRLSFEITEGSVVEEFETAARVLRSLKSLGVTLALDDFGTGYSGLRHLQMLPFDVLKIDATFISNMESQKESRKIVAAIVGLSQNLGLTTVAEGIENQKQSDMLRWLGCDHGQGWLFGRPVPASEVTTVLQGERQLSGRAEPMTGVAERVAFRLEALPTQCLGQLRALYDGSLVGLGFLDPQFRYVALNERLAELHDLPVEAHIGRTINDILPEDLTKELEPRLRSALSGEAVSDFETYRRLHSEVRPRLFQASYQPVRDVAGEVIGISVAVVVIDNAAPREAKQPRKVTLPNLRPAGGSSSQLQRSPRK
jgi:PAS domain S-box-containing protein